MTHPETTSPHVLIIVQNLPVPLDRRVWLECQALVARGYRRERDLPEGPGRPGPPAHRRRRHLQVPPGAGSVRACSGSPGNSPTAGSARPGCRCGCGARRRFDIIQACNPPDTYWLLALLWRPFGVKFVFDHHDLNPELFLSRFGEPTELGACSSTAACSGWSG